MALTSGPRWPDLPYIPLAQQRAGLDDVVGKKTGRGYSSLIDGGETFIDGSFAEAKVPN